MSELNGQKHEMLTPGQDAVVSMLAKMLAAAKRGELDAGAVVCVGKDGALLTDFKGTFGLECQLNMGLDHLKGGVALSFLQSQQASMPLILAPLRPGLRS